MIKVSELKKKIQDLGYDITSLNYEECKLFERINKLNRHKGRLVRHFKGKFYLILEIAEDVETMQEVVVYKAMYENYKVYIRGIDMFLSKVDKSKYPDVKQKYRFEFIELS